jgi:hypothetical protein
MCGGCSSDNNQTNMTFQSWGVGVISLSVVAVETEAMTRMMNNGGNGGNNDGSGR